MTQGVKITDEEKEDAKEWYLHCKQTAILTKTKLLDIYKKYGVSPTYVTKINRGLLRGPIGWRGK